MNGWFQKLMKPRVSLSTRPEHKDTDASVSPIRSFTSSCSSSSSSSRTSPEIKPNKTHRSKPTPPALNSPQRWKRKYDLLVCHSCADSDTEEATRLVSFLEDSPRGLRCFLWQRDVCVGAAVFTEFCQAVQDSHLQALLITPSFLRDELCRYMMHQTLAEGPMSNRLIPLVHNLSHSEYPQELRFCFYIDLSANTDRGYTRINQTVIQYLEDLVKNEKGEDNNVDSSCNKSSEEVNSQKDALCDDGSATEGN
ncbi:toll/interleukin-1 receptor domain-containing adapter protein isoform X2 [Betta splendens]|uniref:Toll/interleukin-1 receptor domain-containing adapter protein isoform X2 n=1 Tax=Betta splendens TaxID=158456 RepID=A0A6P7PBF4_BETSP|nr:toll/interleukin-1 receptor domain-containing adapter protein isoform X2 [Betta splendens]